MELKLKIETINWMKISTDINSTDEVIFPALPGGLHLSLGPFVWVYWTVSYTTVPWYVCYVEYEEFS